MSVRKEVNLSTSVNNDRTHWKHTVLWLEENNRFSVNQNDSIIGTLTYCRLESNLRSYKIKASWKIPHQEILQSQEFYLS